MVSPLLELFHQSARAPGYSLCLLGFSASPPRSDCGGLLRQLYSSGLSPETGRHPFVISERSGSGTSLPLRGSVGSSSATVHSRSSQRPGGFPKPSLSSPRFRVDVMSSGLRGNPSSLACHNRPLRDGNDSSPSGVLLADVRPDVCGHRCDVTVLGRSTGVCLSPVRTPSSGVGEGSGVQESGADVGGSVLASTPVVPGPSGASAGGSPFPAKKEGSSETTPFPSIPPTTVLATVDCVSYIRRSVRQAGFSNAVASQLACCRRRSTRVNYQAKWVVYRSWCHRQGHSVSRPTVAKVADFLLFPRRSLSLSYSSIASYRSMLSGVFRFILPELSSHFVLHDLLRSFRLERAFPSSRVPPWDLQVVLRFLCGPPFEPLASSSLRALTQKVLFLVSLATARRVGELQAVSRDVSFSGSDAFLSYLPEFRAKTELAVNPLPRSFSVRSLDGFVGDPPDELLLCPVRVLRAYLSRTSSITPRPRTLFVSPRSTSRSLSKNALSSFFVMSSPMLTLLPLLLLRLLLLVLRGLIQYVGWLLRGLLRAMLLYLLSWLRLHGPLLLSSLPSIFLTSSFFRLRVLVWDLLWLQVLWCKFLLVWFLSHFAPSLTAGSEYPLGGGVLSLLRSLSCSSLR